MNQLADILIIKAAQETGQVVTVQEHDFAGGLCSVIAELLGLYGLQPEQIVETVMGFMQ